MATAHPTTPARFGRRGRLVFAVVVIAITVVGAACGSTDAASSDEAGASTATGAASGATDLGRLEYGGGGGAAGLAIAEAVMINDTLDGTWMPFAQPDAPPASCRFGDPAAELVRTYLNPATSETVALNVDLYRSEAEADAAIEQRLGPDHDRCIDDGLAELRETVIDDGVYDELDVRPPEGVEASLLADRGGFTRRWSLTLTGPGSDFELDVTTTVYRQADAVITIEVSLLGDDHQRLTELVAGGVEWAGDAPTDPTVDAAVDRLRTAVPAEESPAAFYELFQPAVLTPSFDSTCGGPDAGLVELSGPVWATDQGISALIQRGVTYGSDAEAEAALDAMSDMMPSCIFVRIKDQLLGEVAYLGGEATEVDVDGRRVFLLDISMTQTIDPDNDIQIDVAGITAVTWTGTELLGWEFLGIRGDEPDMAALAVATAERMEAGR
ncbi:MAG: hypothetical protein AAF547_00425 [Actinomycetota bacterium]